MSSSQELILLNNSISMEIHKFPENWIFQNWKFGWVLTKMSSYNKRWLVWCVYTSFQSLVLYHIDLTQLLKSTNFELKICWKFVGSKFQFLNKNFWWSKGLYTSCRMMNYDHIYSPKFSCLLIDNFHRPPETFVKMSSFHILHPQSSS